MQTPCWRPGRLDGAGELRVFFQIVLPQCKPPLATLAELTFLSSWNNFLWPLVSAQSNSMCTLPVALSLYSTVQNATNYSVLLAGADPVVTSTGTTAGSRRLTGTLNGRWSRPSMPCVA
uniref:ABC transporter permease subunit n=1 Tax=Bifidobacterium aemilianum TaxID=2493120 RepID=UPI001EED6820|nr:ABC transporter permease subunit [Bifidobacterium aemilianum]